MLFGSPALTVSSSCLAVVCPVMEKTVKGSGPGAPCTVTLCGWVACFSSELNSCEGSQRDARQQVIIKSY